jgi:GNAT superfamily N-acetyltransferase
VLDDEHLVFVDLRSPQTVRNIERDPRVEVNVVDTVTRTGYRFAGEGSVHRAGDVFDRSVALYRAEGNSVEIRRVVAIRVARALPITSPAYDSGAGEAEVRERWRRYWLDLWDWWNEAGSAPGAADRAPGAATPPDDAPQERWRGDFVISTDPRRLDLDVVHGFLSRSYWSPAVPRSIVERAVRHSLSFGTYYAPSDGTGARSQWTQVGFARVVTDRATFAYIADVFVLEEHRRRGLATWLMEVVSAHPELQGLRRWALATRDAHGLYSKLAFTPLRQPESWMERTSSDPHPATL